jgi:iron complex outermembrane recepter protein
MNRLISLFMAGSAVWAGSVASAYAADAADSADAVQDGAAAAKEREDIVVTGTLIRGVAPVGSEAITVTQQDIKETGGRTVNDVLATIPQFSNLFNRTVTGALGQGRQVVQPQIHGLDTLVLIDGRRLASAGAGASGGATSVDPSIIPTGVLGGIEVVADGGSALYGSDAVGGVVNMTTLKRFNGFSFDGNVTLARNYSAFALNGVAGKDWGTGSIYLAYAYNKTNKIFGIDRPYLQRNPLNNQCSPGTIFARNASGSTLLNAYSFATVNAQGKPAAYTLGQAACNRNAYETVVPDEQMHSVFAGLTQELNSSVSVNLRGFWSQRKSTAYSAIAVYGDEAARGTVVGRSNPYYTPTPEELANPATTSQGANFNLSRAVGNSLPQNSKLENWGVSSEFTANVFGDFQVRLLGNYNESRLDTFNYAGGDTALLQAALLRTDSTALNPYDPASSPGSILVAQQIVNHPQISFGLNRQVQARVVSASRRRREDRRGRRTRPRKLRFGTGDPEVRWLPRWRRAVDQGDAHRQVRVR